jgi:hypothetical protein
LLTKKEGSFEPSKEKKKGEKEKASYAVAVAVSLTFLSQSIPWTSCLPTFSVCCQQLPYP